MTLALPVAPDAQVRAVLYFTKGLGDVVLDEMHERVPRAVVVEHKERFALVELVIADIDCLAAEAQTIDDLRLLVGGPATVDGEEDLRRLCEEAAERARALLGPDRAATERWSVTVSARDPAWRGTPTWSPDKIISSIFRGADRSATIRSLVDLRIQVDRREAHVSLNVTERPLGKRDERVGSTKRPGGLRPTVAASLVRLALADVEDAVAAHGVYDPFCGTGTILVETARFGVPVFGSDIDEAAVGATRARLASVAGDQQSTLAHRVFKHDVLRGPAPRVTARVVVSNLPWGKQVKVDRRGELFDAVTAIVAPALNNGGSCAVLMTREEQFVARLKKHVDGVHVSSRRIGLLGQTPGVVVARAAMR
jgi:hypothetical protein